MTMNETEKYIADEQAYEAKVREKVPNNHSWFEGWTNWHDTPPPANVKVEYMYIDGRRYGVREFEDPPTAWYTPIAAWWWRIPPVGLFYDPLQLDLDTFKIVRADLGPHKATEVWNEARRRNWVDRSLPYDSALARIQRGELTP